MFQNVIIFYSFKKNCLTIFNLMELDSVCELQVLFGDISSDNFTSTLDKMNAKKYDVNVFARSLFNLIPARHAQLKFFSELLSKLEMFHNDDNKNAFIERLMQKMNEPNQQEVCLFFGYLVESNFIENPNELFYSLFKHPEIMDNLQFVQLLYPIFYIGKTISKLPKFDLIMEEFKLRMENIKLGLKLDENSDIYKFLYEQVIEIQNNNWIINDNFPFKQFFECVLEDNEQKLSSLLNNGFIDPRDTLEPTLIVSPSIIGFSPTLISVCAFYGAIKCLKLLDSKGADLKQLDDDSHSSLDFAAASGNVDILKYIMQKTKLDIQTAMQFAIEYFRKDSLDYLTKNNKLTGRLVNSAVKVNNIEILRYLLNSKVPYEERDEIIFHVFMFF